MIVDALNLRLHGAEQENESGFLKLAIAGTHKVAWGPATLTYTASNVSATKEITHGLGATPTVVFPVAESFNADHNVTPSTPGSTKFSLVSRTVSGSSISATINVFWVAIA
jgi:hypothetical protein